MTDLSVQELAQHYDVETLRHALVAKISAQGDFITSSNSAITLFHNLMAGVTQEEFHVAFLNNNNQIIKTELLFRGGVSSCNVFAGIVVKQALLNNSNTIILGHNHPSGNPTPSESDFNMTTRIKSACELCDIKVLDHIIIAGHSHYGFAEHQRI